jgi:hypothetical protein
MRVHKGICGIWQYKIIAFNFFLPVAAGKEITGIKY